MSRLPIEEHNYCIRTVKALCSLPSDDTYIKECDVDARYMSETYGITELEAGTFPLTYKILDRYQRKDKQLLKILKLSALLIVILVLIILVAIIRSPFVEAEQK